jgi:phosphohistidine phosphatase
MNKRRITLLRHAKSDWNSPTRNDYDRPLNARGKHDAPRMGQQLRKRGLHPQLILSSSALRAISTAQIVALELGYDPESVQTDDGLYLATPKKILQILCETGESYANVLLVGHNPGLTDLANRISNANIANIPTCGALSVELDASNWDALDDHAGQLVWFDCPKNIAAPGADSST